MYETFYDLEAKPFSLSPDPRFIYFTKGHCEALSNLVYAIRERKGFLALCAEVGTGKTTLVHALLDLLDKVGVSSAFINRPMLSRSEFFECLLTAFNLKADFASKVEVLNQVNALLLERYSLGRLTVLIIDEAQNLSDEVLEEIRLLSNLETSTEKLLQVILVGQPELSARLDLPHMRQLKQRISLRCSLEPLTLSDTAEYIRTRLQIAGLPNQEIFSDSCIVEIFRSSGGIPRLINTICDNALVTGFASDLKTISVEIIDEVAEDLQLTPIPKPDSFNETVTAEVVREMLPRNPISTKIRRIRKILSGFLKFVIRLKRSNRWPAPGPAKRAWS